MIVWRLSLLRDQLDNNPTDAVICPVSDPTATEELQRLVLMIDKCVVFATERLWVGIEGRGASGAPIKGFIEGMTALASRRAVITVLFYGRHLDRSPYGVRVGTRRISLWHQNWYPTNLITASERMRAEPTVSVEHRLVRYTRSAMLSLERLMGWSLWMRR